MRKAFVIAVLALFTSFAAVEASAQVRVRPNNGQIILLPRLKGAPRVQRDRPINPKLAIIPPSAALKAAMGTIPNAKAIGVKLKGPVYIVKLKQGGTIRQVVVHSATGAVQPMP